MTHLIKASGRTEAWQRGVEYLLDNNQDINLILDIANPLEETHVGAQIQDRIEAHYQAKGRPTINSVAELIFPFGEWNANGIKGVSKNYPKAMARFREDNPVPWGTYAERLVTVHGPDGKPMKDDDGKPFNPLANTIRKMKRANNGGQATRAAYEISINRPWRDDNVLRGIPCLSHLSFKLIEGNVHLTALYRNHDYTYKVPGNLLGLARLQYAVAQEVKAGIGALVVHSTQAYFEGSKTLMRNLVRPPEVPA